ncbi:MAG: LysR family transcriptional regulator [Peptococcaceae bacterium]|jgi:DNA-binding transcriptional LysR family regulator|nr:LysR family transcriptional regulator [Peptococcaceae bacterium]MBQ2004829.1 LysR family transcriptional regulator [Peptococcaceae bacterium]MBQ2021378.1 LysR family transcriptional regulator [Peptococcaceae bacterium]MBQ2369655.1 LysR family transcriptional regulator [Peptococcaceae bacterium]MBQ5369202.1 LysR family transcriptional regulator [Peptococcaceae bacterium]
MLSDSMRVFITVADKKNFSKAAKALSLTQPAVSFQIQTLEQYYQTMLFDRVNRHVKLTAAGELLLDYAVHMNNLQAELERNMQQLTGHVKGELLVGASTTIGEYILPYVVGAFKQEYPDVNATIQIMNTNDIAENVNNKSFDLGIIEGPVELTENMESIAFLEDELVLAIPSNHPFATKESITLEELKTLPYITREPGSGSRLIFEQALIDADFDIEELHMVMELGSTTSIKSAIMGGLGISTISKWAIQDLVKTGKVAALTIEGLTLKRTFNIILNNDKFHSEATGKFLDFLDMDNVNEILTAK